MTCGVGVVRDAEGLKRALRTIARIEAAQPDCTNLHNMTTCATLIAAAALMREESRGAHYRQDFPATSVAARRRHLMFADAIALRHTIEAAI